MKPIILSDKQTVARIETARNTGLNIELVDHTRDELAPVGACYKISSYMPNRDGGSGVQLNGDIAFVYAGSKGLILGSAERKRAHDLHIKDEKK